MPPITKTETMRFWLQVALTIFTGALIPIGLFIAAKLTDIESRMDGFDRRVVTIETWMGEGRRYTGEDAEKDLGVLSQVLTRQGLVIDDHEGRIRTLERQ